MIYTVLYGFTIGAILYFISIGLSLTFGTMRVINFAHTLTYSLGVIAGETVYVSGRGSAKPGGGQHETFKEQAHQAMKNMESALTEAGLGFGHVVWSNIYLDDQDNLDTFNSVYSVSRSFMSSL